MGEIKNTEEVKSLNISPERRFFSAEHDEILEGKTTDIYFIKTMEILKKLNLDDTIVTAEIFARKDGIMAGLPEVTNILKDKNVQIWSIEEGDEFSKKDTIIRIKGPYREFAIFETPILGILAHSCAWATAANECRQAAGESPFVCFGARHVHPAIAPVMERAAIIGGANKASCILGAKLLGVEPTGTVPHSAFLIAGDTVKIAETYEEIMLPESPRIILVDTFKDEVEESLRVAKALKNKLQGIRLDTPSERGGVTPELVKEVKSRLEQEGFEFVKIFVSGGLKPERIIKLKEYGADAFGVGSHISSASPIDMTLDIKEIQGKPVAKRGRIPGINENKKLKKIK